MDNLDRIQEIMQCVGRLWNDCPVQYGSVGDDLHTIADDIQIIKAELLEPETRHGHWTNGDFCSNCSRFPVDCSLPIGNRDLTKYFEYCPHCGAHMDGRD